MTEKEMRRLSRADLLEILIQQTTELEELRGKYAEAAQKLEKREMDVQQAGSLAEAALRLNGVFDAAEAAAKEYLEAVRIRTEEQTALCEKLEQESREAAQKLEQESREAAQKLERESREAAQKLERESQEAAQKLEQESREAAELMKQEAQQYCNRIEAETKAQCAEMTARAKAEAEEYWDQISAKLDVYCEQYAGIRELLGVMMEKKAKQKES